jgi:hypothetical protein
LRAKQKDIVEFYIEQNLERIENTEQTNELILKLDAVIETLINKEGVLIVTSDADDKHERVLTLNVNYSAPSFT